MAETLTELVARIKTDASGLEKGLTDAERKTEASSKKMQESIKKISIAMVAAGAAITAAFALTVKSAMATQSARIAFENLTSSAGQSSAEIIKSLQKASKGTVSEYDLMLSANRAMVLGVAQNSKQFTSLMEIARDRARAMGSTTTQAFNDIVTGIGRGSPLILDNLGIIVDLTEANEKYASGLGKSVSQLTEAEKQQALLNAVLEQGQKSIDKTAQATMTASEQYQATKASIKNLTDQIGSSLLPVLKNILETIVPVINNFISWAKKNPELLATLTKTAAIAGILLTILGGIGVIIPHLIVGVKSLINVFAILHLTTLGYTLIALAAIAAIYGIINIIRLLKGEAYVGTSMGDTIFGQIKQDITDLMGKAQELTPVLDDAENSLTETGEIGANAFKKMGIAANFAKSQIEGISNSTEIALSKLDVFNRTAYDIITARQQSLYRGYVESIIYPTEIRQGVSSEFLGFRTGGIVPGAIGTPQLAMVHGGETVLTPEQSRGISVNVNVAGSVITQRDVIKSIKDGLVKSGYRNYTLGLP